MGSRRLTPDLFDLTGRVAVITGGAGLLGFEHARAIHECGGIPVIADIDMAAAASVAPRVGARAIGAAVDVTNRESVLALLNRVFHECGRVDILINNAARNPKVETGGATKQWAEVEVADTEGWSLDLGVGLTGAFLCSAVFGARMAKDGGGVIVNIASDLALIAPDQRIYERTGVPAELQPKKPASYSAVKAGIVGLTRYFATYWPTQGVRVNALCPGGVENGQSAEFRKHISRLIPMGRLAEPDEYRGALIFLCSDASRYMTGSILVVDGGRTCW